MVSMDEANRWESSRCHLTRWVSMRSFNVEPRSVTCWSSSSINGQIGHHSRWADSQSQMNPHTRSEVAELLAIGPLPRSPPDALPPLSADFRRRYEELTRP